MSSENAGNFVLASMNEEILSSHLGCVLLSTVVYSNCNTAPGPDSVVYVLRYANVFVARWFKKEGSSLLE